MRIWEKWPWTNIHDLNLDWILCNLRKMWDKIHEITTKITEMEPKLLPPGGTNGQVLAKRSTTDYDCVWVDQSGGGGSGRYVSEGGTNGQVLTSDGANGYAWESLPQVAEVPDTSGADEGDVLTVNPLGGYGWQAPPAGGLDASDARQGQVPTADGEGSWEWADQEGGVDASQASAGQVLTANGEGGFGFQTPPSTRQVPTGGAAGQVLTAGRDDSYAWQDSEGVDASRATAGQVLTADGNGGCGFQTPPTHRQVPSGGDVGDMLLNDGNNGYSWAPVPYPTAASYDPKTYGFPIPVASQGETVTLTGLRDALISVATFGFALISITKYSSSATIPYIAIPTTAYIPVGGGVNITLFYIDTTDSNTIKQFGILKIPYGNGEITFEASEAISVSLNNKVNIRWIANGNNYKINWS